VSDRRLATIGSLLALSAFSVVAVLVRVGYTGSGAGLNLVWNLVLAWVPFVLALLVYDGVRRGARHSRVVAGSVLWLLFFPNAPYLVTDFGLLEGWEGAPVWFDVVVVAGPAWAGLALGFASLYLMHGVAARALGTMTAWLLVPCALALASFGIYLGRFERWNSWDVFANPHGVLGNALERLVEPRPLAVTVLFTGFLTVSYLVFYSFVRLGTAERADRR
jgi:uncharacterized membrane protein